VTTYGKPTMISIASSKPATRQFVTAPTFMWKSASANLMGGEAQVAFWHVLTGRQSGP
jgi:hypothetical protein